MLPTLAALILVSSALQDSGALSEGKNPIEFDRTGVRWAHSFQEALERARAEKHLLFLMPDNWAPTENGSLGLECFRAGALCDERIRALIDVRFVPFYFNCFEETAAFDQQALDFVVPEKKEFGKENQSFAGGIPVLLMTPQGKLVGEVGTYMSSDVVLAELQRALKKNASFDAPSKAEKAAREPFERGRFLLARGDLEGAESFLRKDAGAEALVLRARIARLSRDWKKHKKLVAEMKAPEVEDDAAVERARALLEEGQFAKAAAELHGVADSSERVDEARYLEGIAHLGAKDRDAALAIWKALVEGRPQGPWIYRADWAYANVLSNPGPSPGMDGSCPSLLGRESYAGPRNPDLPGA